MLAIWGSILIVDTGVSFGSVPKMKPVLPSDMTEPSLDCQPLRMKLPPHMADAVRGYMYNICDEDAFDIMS
jgi:hypothetical protein